MADWRLWVIGDACGEETDTVMAPFLADSRIRYVNLPWRCGEQALPNSAAMVMARSDLIAFLNHDDLWLPDHLETACRCLRESSADFFVGRSAWTWGQPAGGGGLPAFDCISPEPRDFQSVFLLGYHYVEPVSAWVITRSLAERVGPWRRAMDSHRPPIQEWVLRAWRKGAQLVGSGQVTSLKFENQWVKGAPGRNYDTPAGPQQAVLAALSDPQQLAILAATLATLAGQPAAIGRGMVFDPVRSSDPDVKRMVQVLLSPGTAGFYLQTGLDAYNWLCAELGIPPGLWWRRALNHRTGEKIIEPPELAAVVGYLAEALRRVGSS